MIVYNEGHSKYDTEYMMKEEEKRKRREEKSRVEKGKRKRE